MANGYTVFTTYLLKPTIVAGGYSPAIHCNYIQSIQLNTTIPDIEEVRIIFPEMNDFKFLSTSIGNGTGFTANHIYAIIQLVNNGSYSNIEDVKPNPALWKIVDITSQMTTHTPGTPITPQQLTNQVFKVSLNNYSNFSGYSLNVDVNGLNYPSAGVDDKLCFGDESYFLGNVTTEIHADVYTTELSIILPQGEFNSSTNSTWNGESVYASEIGIYDANNNLVAIGKFNDPVEKNSNISRTILFAIDF